MNLVDFWDLMVQSGTRVVPRLGQPMSVLDLPTENKPQSVDTCVENGLPCDEIKIRIDP